MTSRRAEPTVAGEALSAGMPGSGRGGPGPVPLPRIRSTATTTLAAGSKSFAVATRMFPAEIRDSVSMLYAWCRHCDDEIDAQQAGTAQTARRLAAPETARRLAELRRKTIATLAGEPPPDVVFAALDQVLRQHPIEPALPLAHLDGFAMDAAGVRFASLDVLLVYCWRVAGVVGVMMARIMGVRDEPTLDRACDLGIAFQLTNIARDVVEDAGVGRVYLPGDWLRQEGIDPDRMQVADRAALHRVAIRLLDAAEPYYASAAVGVRALPPRCAWAIATALRTYRAIGAVVRRRGPAAWDRRASTSVAAKLGFVLLGGLDALRARASAGRPVAARGGALWTRPS